MQCLNFDNQRAYRAIFEYHITAVQISTMIRRLVNNAVSVQSNIEFITLSYYRLPCALHKYVPLIYFLSIFVDCSVLICQLISGPKVSIENHFTDAYMIKGSWYPHCDFSLCHSDVNQSG